MRAFIFLVIFSRQRIFVQCNILVEATLSAVRVKKNNKIFILSNTSGVFKCVHLFRFLLLYICFNLCEKNNNLHHQGEATSLNQHSIYTQIALT